MSFKQDSPELALLRLFSGGWLAKIIGTVVKMGVIDALNSPRTIPELSAELKVDAVALKATLNLLQSIGMVRLDGDKVERTPMGSVLSSDSPHSFSDWALLSTGDYQKIFDHYEHFLKTGETTERLVYPNGLYDHLERDRGAAKIFHGAMSSLCRQAADEFAKDVDLSRFESIVDVGGGDGTMLLKILDANAGIKEGIVADCESSREVVEGRKNDRLKFALTDFFNASTLPKGDAFLLKNVLHDWNNQTSTNITRNIRQKMSEAADPQKQRLFVVERVMDGYEASPAIYLDDLVQRLLSEKGTHARTIAEFKGMFTDAGLETCNVQMLSTGHAVFELKPAN